MIRKGQVLGTTKANLYAQAWIFGALLGVPKPEWNDYCRAADVITLLQHFPLLKAFEDFELTDLSRDRLQKFLDQRRDHYREAWSAISGGI